VDCEFCGLSGPYETALHDPMGFRSSLHLLRGSSLCAFPLTTRDSNVLQISPAILEREIPIFPAKSQYPQLSLNSKLQSRLGILIWFRLQACDTYKRGKELPQTPVRLLRRSARHRRSYRQATVPLLAMPASRLQIRRCQTLTRKCAFHTRTSFQRNLNQVFWCERTPRINARLASTPKHLLTTGTRSCRHATDQRQTKIFCKPLNSCLILASSSSGCQLSSMSW
jgi:hypothetical protein